MSIADRDAGYSPLTAEEQAEVDRVWSEWAETLAPGGVLNLDRIKREMFDYCRVAETASRVYMEVTGRKVSKPNTDADVIIGLWLDEVQARVDEAVEDARFER